MHKRHSHIVIFCGSLEAGGAERVISILSKRLLPYFQTVEVLLYYDRPIWYDMDPAVKITSIEKSCKAKSRIGRAWWLRNYIKRQCPALVLSFLSPFNIFYRAASFGLQVPLLVADRSDPRHDPGSSLLRTIRNICYRYAEGIVVQSDYNRKYFNKNIRKKSIVIQNPVEFPDELIGKACRSAKIPEIVSVGRLVPVKNHRLLIDAFAVFHARHPQYRLFIYGEGPCRPMLEEQIREKKLSGSVQLCGSVQNPWKHLLSAEIFILSSDFEGMPNALAEAVCLGLPCISTHVSGASELISAGKTGLLVPPGNADRMTEALETLIDSPLSASVLADHARETASRLMPEKIIGEWIGFIRSILQDHTKNT